MKQLLRIVALSAFLISPAVAQENPDFIGVWQPVSEGAGHHPLHIEQGRWLIYDIGRYEGRLLELQSIEVIEEFDSWLLYYSKRMGKHYWAGLRSFRLIKDNHDSKILNLERSVCFSDEIEQMLEHEPDMDVIRGALNVKVMSNREHPCSFDDNGPTGTGWGRLTYSRKLQD